MAHPTFTVAYDVLNESLLSTALGSIAFVLVGMVIGSVILVGARRRGARFQIAFATVWLLGWVGLGSLGGGNVFLQQWRCMHWAKSGNFEVVEGDVRDFIPIPRAGHANESFVVDGVRFSYSDFNLSKGGFNNTASHGGPIREGLHVRISYRDGRILKLEVARDTSSDS